MWKLFTKYGAVGILNTLIHWAIFLFFYYELLQTQAFSNLLAFFIAVTFSFFVNARFTFDSSVSLQRYVLYVTFMGAMSWLVGAIADNRKINPILTMIIFSLISLLLGFIYSKYVVFRKKSQ
ncbi:GtrA family protein [Serratia sp. D1N4]